MAIRSSPQLNSLRQRAPYQGKKEEELSQQQRAEQLRQQDLANPRRGQPGQAQPTQGQLSGAQKPGMFDVEMDKPAPPSASQEQAAMAATQQGVGQRTTADPESDAARAPAAPAGGDQEKKGSIFDVSPEEEKAAFGQELEAQRAKAMQQAEARAGAAGMGLSGATSQLVSDVGRQQTRAGQLAMGDFERAQAQAQFQDIQRKASIWDLEQASDQDFDGDGFRGNPETGDKPGDPERKDTPEVRTGKGGRMSQEQVSQALLDSEGIRLEDIPEGTGADFANNSNIGAGVFVPDDEVVYTYTSDDGRNVKVRRRGDGTLYLDYEWFS